MLNIYDLINYVSFNFMHNIFNKSLPIHVTNKFEYNITYYNIRNKCSYRTHKYKKNSKIHTIHTIIIYDIKIWNNLNNNCKSSNLIYIFIYYFYCL